MSESFSPISLISDSILLISGSFSDGVDGVNVPLFNAIRLFFISAIGFTRLFVSTTLKITAAIIAAIRT